MAGDNRPTEPGPAGLAGGAPLGPRWAKSVYAGWQGGGHWAHQGVLRAAQAPADGDVACHGFGRRRAAG